MSGLSLYADARSHDSGLVVLCARKTGQTIFANPDTGKSAVVLTSRIGKWAANIQGRKRIAALLTA